MKSLICFSVLSLVACGGPDFSSSGLKRAESISDAGEGSNPSMAGSPGVAGSGMAGMPDKVPGSGGSGNAGSPNVAGMGSAGKEPGVAGQSSTSGGSSGNAGSAGSPTDVGGMGGTGNAGSSSVGGSAGSSPTTNECDATGRTGNWTPIEWVSNTGSTACTTRLNQIGHGLLSLDLPNGCTWGTDISSPDSWVSCTFNNTITCPRLGTELPFTAQVSSHFLVGGQLGGQLTLDSATAGDCSGVSSVSFTATLN